MKEKVTIRVLHRYLGFFMVGILAIYGFSGSILTFRDSHVFKKGVEIEKVIPAHLNELELAANVKLKGFKVTQETEGVMYFREGPYNTEGTYNVNTGAVTYTEMVYPQFIAKLLKMHKANSKSRFRILNTLFGISLIFFSISSFFMFKPKSSIFKKGLLFTIGGIILSLIILFV